MFSVRFAPVATSGQKPTKGPSAPRNTPGLWPAAPLSLRRRGSAVTHRRAAGVGGGAGILSLPHRAPAPRLERRPAGPPADVFLVPMRAVRASHPLRALRASHRAPGTRRAWSSTTHPLPIRHACGLNPHLCAAPQLLGEDSWLSPASSFPEAPVCLPHLRYRR